MEFLTSDLIQALPAPALVAIILFWLVSSYKNKMEKSLSDKQDIFNQKIIDRSDIMQSRIVDLEKRLSLAEKNHLDCENEKNRLQIMLEKLKLQISEVEKKINN